MSCRMKEGKKKMVQGGEGKKDEEVKKFIE